MLGEEELLYEGEAAESHVKVRDVSTAASNVTLTGLTSEFLSLFEAGKGNNGKRGRGKERRNCRFGSDKCGVFPLVL